MGVSCVGCHPVLWDIDQIEAPISAKDGMSAGMYGNTEGSCSYPRWYVVLEESFQLFDFTFVLWRSSFVA